MSLPNVVTQDWNDTYLVSTVKLLRLGLYETMVFRIEDGEVNWAEVQSFRTVDPEEALQNHRTACYNHDVAQDRTAHSYFQ